MNGSDVNELFDALPIVLAAVIAFVMQLVLCLKAKRVWVRLIPTILSIAVVAFYFVKIYLSAGWDVLAYLLFFILACIPAGACVLAWIIYFFVWLIRKIAGRC